MKTSISSFCHEGLFRKLNFAVSQYKHVKPKTTSLGVSKLWSTIFLPSKLTEILEIFPDSCLLKINETVQMFNIFVNFKDTKKV